MIKFVSKRLRKVASNIGILDFARKAYLKRYRAGLQEQYEGYKKTKNVPLPDYVVFEPTGKCNLRCRMCYINFDVTTKLKDVNAEKFKIMIDKMPFIKKISLIGGELFVRRDIFDMLDYLESKNIKFGIGTNATLLNEEKIKRLAKYKNLGQVGVSIDGAEQIHNQIRGPGAFSKTMANNKLMKKHGLFVSIVSVIMKENLDNLKEIAKTVKDAGADYMEFEYERIYTEEIVEKSAKMIGFENTRENFPLSLSQNILPEYTFERLKEKIRDVENYAKKIGLTLGFQPFYFPERLEEYYNRAPRGEHFCKHLFIPRIDCEGNVIFCFAIKKPFGNLTHQSFEEIWYGVELEHFREKFLSSGVLPICETCEKLVCLEKTRNMDGREVIELQTMPGKPNKDFIIER